MLSARISPLVSETGFTALCSSAPCVCKHSGLLSVRNKGLMASLRVVCSAPKTAFCRYSMQKETAAMSATVRKALLSVWIQY